MDLAKIPTFLHSFPFEKVSFFEGREGGEGNESYEVIQDPSPAKDSCL